MLVLGIESSCDETAAALVGDGWELRSSVVASQAELHAPFGGVVPELASRRHVERITAVVDEALRRAGASLREVEGIAVTNRPGLIGSLLIGVTAAKALSLVLERPLVGVHHLEGHLFSNWLAAGEALYPAVALVASGGHTELFAVDGPHRYRVLGRRRDDAAGEAFDKGARVLGLGSGGGAALDRLARGGDPRCVSFPRARTDPPLDFSFSGVKTALIRLVRERPELAPADVAASYQAAIVDVLAGHAVAAAEQEGVGIVLVCGGVACNSMLRERLGRLGQERGLSVLFPPSELCTDNAAMIAAVGHSYLSGEGDPGPHRGLSLEALARSPLLPR